MKQRLDSEMARRGLTASRESARRLIMAGQVRVNSRPANKPDLKVYPDSDIAVIGGGPHYASRAAYKLIAALDHFELAVGGRLSLDVGASSGGFSDVLLQRGVAHVVAVDVGYGQLVEHIRTDPRVTVMDRTNIRYVCGADLPYAPQLVVIDVSFISLKLVLPPVVALAAPRAGIVALVKPQFEVGKGLVERGGVVRDAALRRNAVEGVLEFAKAMGVEVAGAIESPITGVSGNRESLALFHCRADET